MSSLGAPGRAHDAPSTPRREPAASVRAAMESLARAARAVRPRPGAVGPLRLPLAAREAWIDGLGEALSELPVLALVVTPGAILLADAPVLDGAERAWPEGLHRAGVRAITLFAGAPEAELLVLATLLATDWTARGDAPADLADALWGAELPHAWFDLATVASPGTGAPGTPLAALERLELPAEPPTRLGTLTPDAVAALRDLRATLAPEPGALLEVHATAGLVPAELAVEAARLGAGGDLDAGELGAALVAAVAAAGPDGAGRVAQALVALIVDLLGLPDVAPLVHHALEAADTDLAPDADLRAAVLRAYASLGADPLRAALVAQVPAAPTADAQGLLFSVFSLLRDEAHVVALVDVLPAWAVGVLADTTLLRDPEENLARVEAVRARLASPTASVAKLGLAMAARLDDPRLLDAVLALGEHRQPEIREGVLVALRQQALPRVRDLVVKRLDDPAPAVRIEALRYGVAHRLADVLPRVEARLQAADAASLDEAEARALCIAYGRLGRDAAEQPLLDIAIGRRKLGPAFARFALHGLRAIGTPRARAGIEHVASEVPRLREEASALLGEAR